MLPVHGQYTSLPLDLFSSAVSTHPQIRSWFRQSVLFYELHYNVVSVMDQDSSPRSNNDKTPADEATHTNIDEPKYEARVRPETPQDCAIGDSDEDDEELVEIQRILTQSRIMRQKSPEELRKKVIPFHWAPMLSPLSPADIDACETLENATMPDQLRHSNREQVLTGPALAF